VYKLYGQVLKGDNTDWLGIQRPVKARLEAEGRPTRGGTALIVGAGGAAMGGMYAMQQLGMKVRALLSSLHINICDELHLSVVLYVVCARNALLLLTQERERGL
jgi:hypothetical protein